MPLIGTPPRRTRALSRGLSLIELLVGITIGLIVVAGASLLTATQLSDNRRLLRETQVQQDLRAAVDIVTREIRRAGRLQSAYSYRYVWSADDPDVYPGPNPFSSLTFNAGGEKVTYQYYRDGMATPGLPNFSFGFSLVNQTIRYRVSAGTPSDVTDRNTLQITAFEVQPQVVETVQLACPKLCSDGTQNCWPQVRLTDVVVTVTGQPVGEPQLSRTITSRVRTRNEGITSFLGPTQVCP
jgi:type IV pilus assembly protein PilW